MSAHVYDVTLYETKDGPHFWSDSVKSPRVIRVSTAFEQVKDQSGNLSAAYAQAMNVNAGGPELWVQLMEKAYAVLRGGYAKMGNGGSEQEGSSALLPGGVTNHTTDSKSPEENCALIHQALAQHRPVTAGLDLHVTNGQFWRHKLATKYAWFDHVFGDSVVGKQEQRIQQLNVVSKHEYAVKSVDMKAKTISLQNPWHTRHIDNLAFEDFNLVFGEFAIGDA